MKIAVLYGGNSREREISIKSGKLVSEALKKLNYKVQELDTAEPVENWIGNLKNFDCVFVALHGEFGEDGRIQGLLDFMNVPYTCSDSYTSFVCFDKYVTKLVLKTNGFVIPNFLLLKEPAEFLPENFNYPVVLKPRYGGSSIDVKIVHNQQEFEKVIGELLERNKQMLLEEFIDGKEITVSVMEEPFSSELHVFPILELRPKREFYDYIAKYTEGLTEFVVPAEISPELENEVKEIGKRIYELFNCKGVIRIDGKLFNDRFYIFEINTIPGLTELSDVPISAKAEGMSYEELIDKIVQSALKRRY
ncbi:MAG: D-alanine-D-alanine ligase [Thermotogaceae bacterium]|nr:D-alanine-D-alanine ligase [Thermotogaceae bacterium]MDN5337364.1 D-alanine-D-alanine ligase [Thermotogaceae bacterium]